MRKDFFSAIAAAAISITLLITSSSSSAQEIKILAPASPGGGWDQTARSMQQVLNQAGLAKNVQVNNIPGAGGTVGLAQFAGQAKGDASSWMVGGLVMVGAILTNKSPVNLSEVTPLARLTAEYELVVVPASSPHQKLSDLLAAMKANPGSIAWAGGSAGGTDHITVGLLALESGIDPAKMNYVPFSGGGEALAALIGGQVAAGISGFGEWYPQVEAGKLRALCITAPERLANIDIPTCKEAGTNVELANWRGVFGGPDLTADGKKDALATLDKMSASAEWKKILQDKNWLDSYQSGDAFAAFIDAENERITKVLKSIGLVQ